MHSPKLQRPGKQNLIKTVTAQSVGSLRQSGTAIKGAEVQLESPHASRFGCHECIPNLKRFKQGHNLWRKKFAAHFLPRESGFFNQANIAPFLPCGNRGGRPGRTSAEDTYGSQGTRDATVDLLCRSSAACNPACAR